MDTQVNVDLVRDEVLIGRPSIAISTPAGADADTVRRAVAVQGVDGEVRATRGKGRFTWSPPAALAPGRYQLVVEPLADRAGKKLSDAVRVPFTVVASKASLPSNVRVESFSRVRLGTDGSERLPTDELPRGNYVDFVKATDRKSGAPVELAFDQDGRRIEAAPLLVGNERAVLTKAARIQPQLRAAAGRAKRGEKLTVDLWVDVDEPEPTAADRPLHDADVELATQRGEEARQRANERVRDVVGRLTDKSEVLEVDEFAPVARVRVAATKLDELADVDGVAALFLHEEDAIMDLGDSIAIARSNTVHSAGETGSGVRVAVWESGPTSNDDLVIAGRYLTNPSTSNHSQNVHAIIRNNESGTPDGHAPGCSLYSANSTARAALTWAVRDRDCTVVNQSFHRSSEPGSSGLSSDDLYGDWLALHWPYPLIVHAAGNFWSGDPDGISPPSSEYVNHKGYNTISVGNHDDEADAMSGSSVFRNPSSPHGDRELPEIAANGTGVTADSLTMSGTSMASPAVCGVAALVQGTSATLKHWPEGCRSILFASAGRNVRDGTWWQDVVGNTDARDGAGAVDASEARNIALNRRHRNASATRRGWDVGLLSSSDFGSNKEATFDYKVAVPNWFLGPRNVKVALAWTSKVANFLGLIYTSQLTVDLDLKVYDSSGNQVGYSGSWDNSYEIAEFVGQPGQTYTIKIRRWSGTDSTWYGIAWTVTGGRSFTIPFEELLASRFTLGTG